MDDGMLEYFITQTNRRLEDIEEKLDVLIEFQIAVKTNHKTVAFFVSFVVSAVVGLLPLLLR